MLRKKGLILLQGLSSPWSGFTVKEDHLSKSIWCLLYTVCMYLLTRTLFGCITYLQVTVLPPSIRIVPSSCDNIRLFNQKQKEFSIILTCKKVNSLRKCSLKSTPYLLIKLHMLLFSIEFIALYTSNWLTSICLWNKKHTFSPMITGATQLKSQVCDIWREILYTNSYTLGL